MRTAPDDRPQDDRESRSWHGQIPTLITVGLIGGIITAGFSFGAQMLNTGKTSVVLVAKVERIEKQNDTQESLLRDMIKTQAAAYTRDEARADREAADRRFISLEGRIGELSRGQSETWRRIEALETRYMQQSLIDRGQPPRRQ